MGRTHLASIWGKGFIYDSNSNTRRVHLHRYIVHITVSIVARKSYIVDEETRVFSYFEHAT